MIVVIMCQNLENFTNILPEERVERDPNAEPASDEEDLSPQSEDWQPSAAQLADLKLALADNGHPSNADPARMLKLGHARREVVRCVRQEFKWDGCETNKKPRAKRPSAFAESYRFNHVVGIDLVDVKTIEGIRQKLVKYGLLGN